MIQRGYLESNQGQLHYRFVGEGDKPTLILLHQAPSHSGMFEKLMAELAEDFFCVAPDFPGCGMSDSIDNFSIENIAEMIASAFERFGNVAGIFGHHSGSAVAAELAANYYKSAQFVVFSGPALLTEKQKQKLPAVVPDKTLFETGEHLNAYWVFTRSKDTQVELELTQREVLSALSMGKTYKQLYQAVADYDFAASVKKITCPTVVFAGDRDVLKPSVDPTVALLKKGQKAEIGDASTYVCETHACRVAELIRNMNNESLD